MLCTTTPTSIRKGDGFVSEPAFMSPITLPAPTGSPLAELSDLSHWGKVLLRGTGTVALAPFGRSIRFGDAIVAGIRPEECLLLDPSRSSQNLVRFSVNSSAVVELTHGRGMIELTGPRASGVLEKLCDLDLSDAMTPDGAVVAGYVARIVCELIRQDRGSVVSYLVVFDRSYGRYLMGALQVAMKEFNAPVQKNS